MTTLIWQEDEKGWFGWTVASDDPAIMEIERLDNGKFGVVFHDDEGTVSFSWQEFDSIEAAKAWTEGLF